MLVKIIEPAQRVVEKMLLAAGEALLPKLNRATRKLAGQNIFCRLISDLDP